MIGKKFVLLRWIILHKTCGDISIHWARIWIPQHMKYQKPDSMKSKLDMFVVPLGVQAHRQSQVQWEFLFPNIFG
jgi:hypothetical protein